MRKVFKKSALRDMTEGSILQHMVIYTLPLLCGSIFQVLCGAVAEFIYFKVRRSERLAKGEVIA